MDNDRLVSAILILPIPMQIPARVLQDSSRFPRAQNQEDRSRELLTLGQTEFERASNLYESGKIEEALAAVKPLAKLRKYRDAYVREDALFLLGECYFDQQRYPAADDAYSEVLNQYPNSRYTDKITKRLFHIARIWLNQPSFANQQDIQPVNYERPSSTPPPETGSKGAKPLSYRIPILPNMSDRKRPVFDTQGRALNSLRHIWLKDPTGPLADDALMLTGTYHLRNGNYLEADRLFSILRSEYPKSEHIESAFVIGSHVKLMSYQGASYDRTKLDEAEKLKKSSLTLFPESKDSSRLKKELTKVQELKVRREWERVLLYQQKGKPQSVAVYCKLLIDKYPNSPYARKAETLLQQMDPQLLARMGLDSGMRRPPATSNLAERSGSSSRKDRTGLNPPINRSFGSDARTKVPRTFPENDNSYRPLPLPSSEPEELKFSTDRP